MGLGGGEVAMPTVMNEPRQNDEETDRAEQTATVAAPSTSIVKTSMKAAGVKPARYTKKGPRPARRAAVKCRRMTLRPRKARVTRPPANETTWWGDVDMKTAQQQDSAISLVLSLKQSRTVPTRADLEEMTREQRVLARESSTLKIERGVLYRVTDDLESGLQKKLLVLPAKFQKNFVEECHVETGHGGRSKTAEQVCRRVYFNGWRRIVREVCQQCVTCSQAQHGQVPKQGELHLMEVENPMDRLGIDLSGPHVVTARKNVYILVCVDHFTRYVVAVPIKNKSATCVAKALQRNVFEKFGLCREI